MRESFSREEDVRNDTWEVRDARPRENASGPDVVIFAFAGITDVGSIIGGKDYVECNECK